METNYDCYVGGRQREYYGAGTDLDKINGCDESMIRIAWKCSYELVVLLVKSDV